VLDIEFYGKQVLETHIENFHSDTLIVASSVMKQSHVESSEARARVLSPVTNEQHLLSEKPSLLQGLYNLESHSVLSQGKRE
jgi:hypothetical protein